MAICALLKKRSATGAGPCQRFLWIGQLPGTRSVATATVSSVGRVRAARCPRAIGTPLQVGSLAALSNTPHALNVCGSGTKVAMSPAPVASLAAVLSCWPQALAYRCCDADPGTSVVNGMKDDAREVIDEWHLKGLIPRGTVNVIGPVAHNKVARHIQSRHPQVDVGRIGDGYATGKATKSGISNLGIARATVAAFGPDKSINEKLMVLPSDIYELYIEFVVHLLEGAMLLYPVERLLSHHMSMVDALVDAEQLRTGTSAKKLADLEHSLKIHKAYLKHANEKHVYPEKLTARKLAGLNLEPAEMGERDRWNPPVMDVRGIKMGPQKEEPLPDGKPEEEAGKTGEDGGSEENAGNEEDDEEVAAEGDDAAAAATGGGGEGEVVEEEEEDDKTASEDDDTEKPMGEDDSKKEEKKGASKEALHFQKLKRKPEAAGKEAQKQAKKPRAS
ncbi:hypothetical protein CYMTET_18028 [Cymbomonas tetramitiformis]|uniref:Uncharacterized protein n=1 Tax=Cymbomonas tetramitiformis TaxID=36881 RepID=A0AAE0G924_9CHLO|nr:hypothetical protein CYMTET_18028 [Cymbomonas tetramitiformis]